MGKCCAVDGCLSGRKASEHLGKDIEMLSKWSTALGKELKNTNFICELHFNPNDVIKSNQEVLKDGIHLKKNAIPQSNVTTNENNYSSLSDDVRSNTSGIINDDIIVDCSLNSIESIESIIVNEIINEVIEPDNKNSTNTNFSIGTNNLVNSDNLVITNEPEKFSFHSIEKILEVQPLRKNWSWTVIKDSYISLSYINLKLELVCHVKIHKDLKVTIVNAKTNILIDMDVNISSIDCVWQLLNSLENTFFCSGTGYDDKKCSVTSTGILLPEERYKRKVVEYRCITCRKLRRLIQKRKTETTNNEARWMSFKHRYILQRRKLNRVVHTNKNLKQQLLDLKNQCAEIKEEVLSEKIADLPALQQETIKNCLLAAKAKSAKQRRYSVEWVYECLLMSIKSSALYEHIRKKNILPLPCKDTLMRYIQKLDSAFGFPKAIFDTLKLKGSRMEVYQKRGILSVDEIALSEGIALNRKTLKLEGFVDLGEYTPDHLRHTRADHALVFMFQPFQGKNYFWNVQFCLRKLVFMWTELYQMQHNGIAVYGNCSAYKMATIVVSTHIIFQDVYGFFSDFPHLLKNFRNKIMEQSAFWTPDGIVKKKHWNALLQYENYLKANLKMAYKLTPHHLKPEGYQKMNIPLAVEPAFTILQIGLMDLVGNFTLFKKALKFFCVTRTGSLVGVVKITKI
ncbi:Protein of unknown function [Cotesia congregata]|uniref:THAP-type domain-containing protein n=1 Tax=Cotesia congregata TaxID=51543 RepID=A0A8J2MMY0_COTCN|nr:Protein of unknown function [Cotesia congregata]